MSNELDFLKSLADDESDFINFNNHITLSRYGNDYEFDIITEPFIGQCVVYDGKNVPLDEYIQKHIIGLDKLSQRIIKTLESKGTVQKYIEPPSQVCIDTEETIENASRNCLLEIINRKTPLVTELIEIMAMAGQGKTMLLDAVAYEAAKQFIPAANPKPLLIPVDLLGRVIASIPDAIAGTLLNEYKFPLSQKDFIACMKKDWMVLALDGFDELVARLGPKEAYDRINDIIEQLEGHGIIIISARKNFFDLYNIGSAIQSYLKPQKGSFQRITINLLPWTKDQCLLFLGQNGSEKPEQEYEKILEAYAHAIELIENPFFFTKIAEIYKGKIIQTNVFGSLKERIKTLIDEYIKRESSNKWKSIQNQEVLSVDEHNLLLGVIAEEMWKTVSFKVKKEELDIIIQLALNESRFDDNKKQIVYEKMPMHAALIANSGMYQFTHEVFLWYYLGQRIAYLLNCSNYEDLFEILKQRELNPITIQWVEFDLNQKYRINVVDAITNISKKNDGTYGYDLSRNISSVLVLLGTLDTTTEKNIQDIKIYDLDLDQKNFLYCNFTRCSFFGVSLKGYSIIECIFNKCNFYEVIFPSDLIVENTIMDNCIIKSPEINGQKYYMPDKIEEEITKIGFTLYNPEEFKPKVENIEIIQIIYSIIKYGNKHHINVLEELYNGNSEQRVRKIYNIGIKNEVFKNIEKDVSGPKKTFFKINCDKDQLEKSIFEEIDNEKIDAFWNEIKKVK